MVLVGIANDATELDAIQNLLLATGAEKLTVETQTTVEVKREQIPMLEMAETALGTTLISGQTGLLRVWNVSSKK